MQNTLIYIYFSLMAAWLLPPLKQFRTKYFFYFLLLAISDPTAFIFYKTFHVNMWLCHVIFSTLTAISLINFVIIKKYYYVFILIIAAVFYFLPEVNPKTLLNIVTFNIIMAIFIIARDFIMNIREAETINIFYVVLLLYNISTMMKILFRVNYTDTGYLYFFLTNFFQIFIALYFIFYNVNNSKKIKLFKDEEAV